MTTAFHTRAIDSNSERRINFGAQAYGELEGERDARNVGAGGSLSRSNPVGWGSLGRPGLRHWRPWADGGDGAWQGGFRRISRVGEVGEESDADDLAVPVLPSLSLPTMTCRENKRRFSLSETMSKLTCLYGSSLGAELKGEVTMRTGSR
jgi:hypothetical protein